VFSANQVRDTFFDFHECICVRSSSISKTVARHFWVVSLSKVYHIRIYMRDFFRVTFQDYWHMQTSDATCQSQWSHASVSFEPSSRRRHWPTDSSQPPSSLPSSSVLASDAVKFHWAFSGWFRDIFACMYRLSQIRLQQSRSLSCLSHLPNLLRPQSIDSHPPSSPPSSEPSQSSIRQLSASVGSAIFWTFLDLNLSTPSW
jgi:hypothetical protein